jgi:hypothetical protein
METVWITFDTPPDCQCWRDALCSHGLTWQEEEPMCLHIESYQDVQLSLADAIRALYSIRGQSGVGCLLRERDDNGQTHNVFVMPPSDQPYVDDHEGWYNRSPSHVITRYRIGHRSKPHDDPKHVRQLADSYRGR